MYIAVAGNIGSGKTLLTDLLAKRLGWVVADASIDERANPYIDDFYDNMKEWSFHLQVYFLGMRVTTLDKVFANHKDAIVDRTIYEDAEVFARNLFNQSLISTRDWESYYELYNLIIKHIEHPDLLIYIRSTNDRLLRNIKKRGRPYEASIDKSYLDTLNELYENWTFLYDGELLIVDIDKDDFGNDLEAQERVLRTIEERISKL